MKQPIRQSEVYHVQGCKNMTRAMKRYPGGKARPRARRVLCRQHLYLWTNLNRETRLNLLSGQEITI